MGLVGLQNQSEGKSRIDDILVIVASIVPSLGRGYDGSRRSFRGCSRRMHHDMRVQVSCRACVLASILSFQALPRTLIVIAFDGCFQGFRIGIAGNDEALLMSSCYQGISARLGDRGEVYLLADLAGEWGFLGGCMFCAPDGFTLLVSDEEAFGLCLRLNGCYLAFMDQIANLVNLDGILL